MDEVKDTQPHGIMYADKVLEEYVLSLAECLEVYPHLQDNVHFKNLKKKYFELITLTSDVCPVKPEDFNIQSKSPARIISICTEYVGRLKKAGFYPTQGKKELKICPKK